MNKVNYSQTLKNPKTLTCIHTLKYLNHKLENELLSSVSAQYLNPVHHITPGEF